MATLTGCQSGTADRGSGPGRSAAGPRADLAERVGGFTSGMTARDGYRGPARAERDAVADGVGHVLDGDLDGAARRLADVDFTVRTFTDSATGRRTAEVADAADGGEATRGWGRVYVDLGAAVHWSVQVPHPVADVATEDLGVDVLRSRPGGVLVLAGTHRDAGRDGEADAAHRRDTVFHAVCRELVRRGLPGVQLHGFADDSVPGEDAVVSTGRGDDALPDARALADALRERGLDVCRAWASRCELEGRTNRQGRTAAEHGVPFVHLELSRGVRDDPERAGHAVDAVARMLARWA
ncbi:hypothetical protein [Streptomyces sp. JWR5-1]|uniref:hypothetical protein n=2 Tax=Streptomyces TaxID=1883 RepID=UPI0030181093